MAEPVKLSPDDLAGATEIAPVKLSANDLAGATDLDGPSVPQGQSFLRRGWESIKSGAHDVAHVAGEFSQHPIDTVSDPSKRREFERGLDSMATLGYGQKAARALEDTNFGRAMNRAMGQQAATLSPEQEAADSAAAPGYRTAGGFTGLFTPGAANIISKGAGAVVKPLTNAVGEGATALAARAAQVPGAGKVLAPLIKGAGGAGEGAISYEAGAPAISAASADASGHRVEAAEAAAADPSGLLLSSGAGAAPHLVAPVAKAAGKAVTGYVEHAPAAADAWVIKDLRGQTKGETTATARKYLAADETDVLATLKRDPELAETLRDARHSDRGKLEKASAAIDSKISEVNSPRQALYDEHVDSALGGGIRAGDFVKKLRDAAEEHRADGTPGGHKMADYLDARAATLEKSKNWGAETTTEPARELSPEMADQLHQLKAVLPNVKDPAMLAQISDAMAKLQGETKTTSKFNPEARVPSRTARKVVTDIQDAAYDGLGGLADTRAAGHAREVAHNVSGVFNGFLDEAATKSPQAADAVAQIRDINTQHSALKNIQKVIDQRLGKATENATGAGGHVATGHNAIKRLVHGSAGLAAAELAAHGRYGLAAATLGIAAAPEIKRFVDTKSAKLAESPGYKAAVERVARAARKATAVTDFVREATAAGLPVSEAHRIYRAAHPQEKRDEIAQGAP